MVSNLIRIEIKNEIYILYSCLEINLKFYLFIFYLFKIIFFINFNYLVINKLILLI